MDPCLSCFPLFHLDSACAALATQALGGAATKVVNPFAPRAMTGAVGVDV